MLKHQCGHPHKFQTPFFVVALCLTAVDTVLSWIVWEHCCFDRSSLSHCQVLSFWFSWFRYQRPSLLKNWWFGYSTITLRFHELVKLSRQGFQCCGEKLPLAAFCDWASFEVSFSCISWDVLFEHASRLLSLYTNGSLRRSYFSNMLHTWNQQFNFVWSHSMFASNRDSSWIDPVFFLSEELLQVTSSWQCSDRGRRCPHMLRREAAGTMDGKELVIWHWQHLQQFGNMQN